MSINDTAINKYLAKECGVVCKQYAGGDWYFIAPNIEESHYEWNYKDPRCREIIREHFKIETLEDNGLWYAYISGFDYDSCKTIAEAEIACIESIYNSEGID